MGCTPKVRFAPDSALERAGFEPSVPRRYSMVSRLVPSWSRSILGAAAQPSSCGLTNRSDPMATLRGAAAYAESGGATEGGGALGDASASRNRSFESIFLPQRVSGEPGSLGPRAKPAPDGRAIARN